MFCHGAMEFTYIHLVDFMSMFQDCGGKKIVHMGDQVGIDDGDDRLLGGGRLSSHSFLLP